MATNPVTPKPITRPTAPQPARPARPGAPQSARQKLAEILCIDSAGTRLGQLFNRPDFLVQQTFSTFKDVLAFDAKPEIVSVIEDICLEVSRLTPIERHHLAEEAIVDLIKDKADAPASINLEAYLAIEPNGTFHVGQLFSSMTLTSIYYTLDISAQRDLPKNIFDKYFTRPLKSLLIIALAINDLPPVNN